MYIFSPKGYLIFPGLEISTFLFYTNFFQSLNDFSTLKSISDHILTHIFYLLFFQLYIIYIFPLCTICYPSLLEEIKSIASVTNSVLY